MENGQLRSESASQADEVMHARFELGDLELENELLRKLLSAEPGRKRARYN